MGPIAAQKYARDERLFDYANRHGGIDYLSDLWVKYKMGSLAEFLRALDVLAKQDAERQYVYLFRRSTMSEENRPAALRGAKAKPQNLREPGRNTSFQAFAADSGRTERSYQLVLHTGSLSANMRRFGKS